VRLRPPLFCDVTLHRMVAGYRHFVTSYRSHFQASRNLLALTDPWRWDQIGYPATPVTITNLRKVFDIHRIVHRDIFL